MNGREKGFTLVELVVVLVVLGILAAMGAAFIAKPMESYLALNRRAALNDAAENALRRMQRDVRQALPNSIQVPAAGRIDFLHTADGGRYRAEGPGNILDFEAPDGGFEVLGTLRADPVPGQWLVVYNLAASGGTGNAYAGDNRAVVTGGNAGLVQFTPFQFPRSSPYRRFFLVDEAVSYVCDPAAGTLTRVVAAPGAPGSALVTRHVTGCNFTYAAGTSWRAGMVTLELSLAADGEQVKLLHQIHVGNAP